MGLRMVQWVNSKHKKPRWMEKSGIYIHQNGYLRVKSWRASVQVAATRNKMPVESHYQNFIDAADVNVAVESRHSD